MESQPTGFLSGPRSKGKRELVTILLDAPVSAVGYANLPWWAATLLMVVAAIGIWQIARWVEGRYYLWHTKRLEDATAEVGESRVRYGELEKELGQAQWLLGLPEWGSETNLEAKRQSERRAAAHRVLKERDEALRALENLRRAKENGQA